MKILALAGLLLLAPSFVPAGPVIGVTFCDQNQINSTGVDGQLSATGSVAAADNDVTLHAWDLPQNSFGFAIVSRTQGLVNSPSGPGFLCINGQIGRYVNPAQIMNSGTSGSFDITLDMTRVPTPTGFVSTVAGDTWHFQVWYRDLPHSHFTNGVEIAFL